MTAINAGAQGHTAFNAAKGRARRRVDAGLVRLGGRAWPGLGRALNGAANYVETGRLLREAGLVLPPPVLTRFDVFDVGIARCRRASRPLYLEFGVWKGESIEYWARSVANRRALFVGFDSFEGLPEDWTASAERGAFTTFGAVPETRDARVSYVKGWFAETVPSFAVPAHDQLIINIDCDLYASTATVLESMRHVLCAGDLLYFDEFHDRLHEGRAFHELRIAADHRYRVVASTAGATNILFELTHSSESSPSGARQ